MKRLIDKILWLAKGLAITLFVGLLAGLPLAVELGLPIMDLGSKAVLARFSDAVAIRTRITLSKHVPLTLDSGLISPAAADVAPGGGLIRLQVDEPELTLDLSRSALPDAVAALESETALIARLGGFKAGAVQLRRGGLTIISSTRTRYRIDALDATISSARPGQFKLVGQGRHNGQKLNLEAAWSVPEERGGNAPVRLRLNLRSDVIEATFNGLLGSKGQASLTGQAELKIPSLGRLVTWVGIADRIGDRIRAITVSGPLAWNPMQMAFAPATVDIDGNRAVGALTLRHSAERPAIDATLAFDELRLPAFAATAADPQSLAGRKSEPRLLALFDADLRLSAARIVAPGVSLGRGAVSIALNQGRLEADLVGVELEGGSAEGRFSLDVTKPVPQAAIKLKAKSIDIGHLLTRAGPLSTGAVEGRADVAFEGRIAGHDLASALSRVSGRGHVTLAQAGQVGLDIAALVAAARSTPVVSWPAAGKGAMAIEKLSCSFRLLDGAVTIEGLQARSGARALYGSGRIDVPARLMDFNIGEGPASSGEAPITSSQLLSMQGTWNNPAIRLVTPAHVMPADSPAN